MAASALPAIHLDTPDWIPAVLQAQLAAHATEFQAAGYFDSIKSASWSHHLLVDLQRASSGRRIIAYDCTREATPGEIALRGLRTLKGGGDAHRAEFLARHGGEFTADERLEIERKFTEVWGDGRHSRGRENRLCFALVHPRHWGYGCHDLLGIYGGESIYNTWGREGPIVERLRTIGQPAVVHFRLDPILVNNWIEYPVGQTAMWAWHSHLQPDVREYWCEGHTSVDVPPSDILEVENWSLGSP